MSARAHTLALLALILLLPGRASAHHADSSGACVDGRPALLVPVRNGDGYIHLAERYLGDGASWPAVRKANGGRAVQVGRSVSLPLALLPPELRLHALRTLFPRDAYEAGEWVHKTGGQVGKPCAEDATSVASWFTGREDLAGDLARLNNLPAGKLPAGRTVRIPREMLLPGFVPADAPVSEPTLAYGEDERGPYAVYRLRAGEALYSAVVVRFTGRLDADEVNQLATEIAERSGVRDVRDIPIGYGIKIPRELLLPRYLAPEDPDRIAWERERDEVAQHVVPVRARRLAGVHVILDAGHGGIDVGTTHSGMDEDEYVYDVMCRVKRRLERDTDAMTLTTVEDRKTGYEPRDLRQLPRDRNEIIRTTPLYVPKESDASPVGVNLRWYLANSFYRRLVERGIDGDKIVFVSFHADSLHPAVDGAMVYIPGEKYRVGRYGSSGTPYGSYEEVRQNQYVSFDRNRRLRAEGMSREFSDRLIETLKARGLPVHAYNPVRDHVIRRRKSWVPAVIRCSESPVSVLVELVNLNNSADRERMRDPAFREKLAEAFVGALQAFYDKADPATAPAARTAAAAPAAGSR